MTEHPYDFLRAEPEPPQELHALLRYLSDAFTLLDDWILQPPGHDPDAIRIADRRHVVATPEDGQAGPGRFGLNHPDTQERRGYTDRYERNAAGAEELQHDIVVHAVERTEARSQWNTWETRPRPPEEIRIALRDAPGYHVQCPLDCDGKPMHVIATLEIALEDEDPAGPRTREVPVNRETEHLLQRLAACVRPLNLELQPERTR